MVVILKRWLSYITALNVVISYNFHILDERFLLPPMIILNQVSILKEKRILNQEPTLD